MIPSIRHIKQHRPIPVMRLLTLCFLCAASQSMTEYVVPHPRHAQKSVKEAVTEAFDDLARTPNTLGVCMPF